MEPETQEFDRIRYVCPVCHKPGCIVAAWASLTHIKLEGHCPRCGIRGTRSFDMLAIDEWLRDETDSPCRVAGHASEFCDNFCGNRKLMGAE